MWNWKNISNWALVSGKTGGLFGREVLTDVCYNVRKDALVVWQEGLPIYANLGGQIETDEVTLADNAIYL